MHTNKRHGPHELAHDFLSWMHHRKLYHTAYKKMVWYPNAYVHGEPLSIFHWKFLSNNGKHAPSFLYESVHGASNYHDEQKFYHSTWK